MSSNWSSNMMEATMFKQLFYKKVLLFSLPNVEIKFYIMHFLQRPYPDIMSIFNEKI